MTFDYEVREVEPFPGQPTSGIVFRPIVSFRVRGTRDQIRFRGLADSGADMTVLPVSVADFVGYKILSPAPHHVSGVGGRMELSYGKVIFELGAGRYIHRWCATVGITRERWAEAILGHVGFLQFFDATFMGHANRIQIKRNKRKLEPVDLFNA